MKSKLVAARFLSTFLPFLVGLLLVGMAGVLKTSGADEKKQVREESWKTVSSPAGKSAAVEVRFTDNSLLKLRLDDDRLELTTSHGKLSIAIPEIHRIDFATRVAPETAKRIQPAIRNLGSSEFR